MSDRLPEVAVARLAEELSRQVGGFAPPAQAGRVFRILSTGARVPMLVGWGPYRRVALPPDPPPELVNARLHNFPLPEWPPPVAPSAPRARHARKA